MHGSSIKNNMSTQKKSKVQDTIESQQLNDRTIFLWGGVNDKTARHVALVTVSQIGCLKRKDLLE